MADMLMFYAPKRGFPEADKILWDIDRTSNVSYHEYVV